jgi:hypothetical protein
MRIMINLGLTAASLATMAGCATSDLSTAPQVDFALPAPASNLFLHAGEVTILDSSVNPLAPLDAARRGDQIAVTFGQRRAGVVALVDPRSARPDSREPAIAGRSAKTASMTPQAVTLQSGRRIVCWTAGNIEDGYRAFAQVFAADGVVHGEPIVISPAEADVLGAPHVATVDGQHAVATFVAAFDGIYKLVAVPLEGS